MTSQCSDAETSGATDWEVAVQSFRIHGQVIHGWGKLQGSGDFPPVTEMQVRDSSDSLLYRIPLILGDYIHQSAQCFERSFVISGPLPEPPEQGAHFVIYLEWPDARLLEFALPIPRSMSGTSLLGRFLDLPWAHYLSRGITLIRQGDWRLLLGKLEQMAKAAFVAGMSVSRLLDWMKGEGKPLCLLIDHDLGGGANQFRLRLAGQLAEQGMAPVTLSMHHGVLAYQLSGRQGKRLRHSYTRDIADIFQVLATRDLHAVFFNNILSYPNPQGVVSSLSEWLHGLTQKPRFIFFVHDYYSICPSFQLLDYQGKYCAIPGQEVCSQCLPSNKAKFIRFAMDTDITAWRGIWFRLLSLADEIRCFSESSRQLVLKAYPALDEQKVTVVPHTLNHLYLRKVCLDTPGSPVIGIFGHIAYHKGSRVVRELAEYLQSVGSPARLVIVGTIDEKLPSPVTTVTGAYSPQDMPNIIKKHGINLALFPSICPETFSFVVAELVEMGMPVLCFNLGAPAERVAGYERGMVIESTRPDNILRGLEQLYHRHVKPPVKI